ncbi:MAG TPA: DUF222 domain-containing protein [Actinomycetota bacterium]
MVAAPMIDRGSDDDRLIDELIDAVRAADALNTKAAALLGRLASSGVIARRRGLPGEVLIRLAGRRTRWQARDLFAVSDALRMLPKAAQALDEGSVSYAQMIAIARAIAPLDAEGRSAVDELVARRARALVSAEPERLVLEVDDLVAGLRDDLLARREQRAVDRNFLALQPRFEGGGSLYGEADAEAFATLAEALDRPADPPAADGDDDQQELGSRARQRMDALVGICESWLAGGANEAGAGSSAASRPRPRFLVSVDVADELGIAAAGRILQRVAGQPVRLSRLATETLLCDAQIQIIAFKDGQPIGISDITQSVPAKARAAVVARDGGCRFPGCGMPAAWSEAHHIIPRPRGDNGVGNLILLCRRCHRRIHHRGWRLRFLADGTAEFRHRGRIYISQPRARAPARE